MIDLEYAHACFRFFNNQRDLAIVSNLIGILHLFRSRYFKAIEWFHKCLDLNQSLGLASRIIDNLQNLGITYYKLGKYIEALKYLEAAIQTPTITPDRLCRAKIALGNVHRLQRDFDKARELLTDAYSLASNNRIPYEECLALEFLGDVYRDDEKPGEARRYYERGMAIARKIAPEGDLEMELLRREGECLDLEQRSEEALPVLERALTLADEQGNRFEAGVIKRCLATALWRLGRPTAARKHIKASIDLLDEISARHELAISHLQATRILMALTEAASDGGKCADTLTAEAWQHAVVCQGIFDDLRIEYWSEQIKGVITTVARRHLAVDGERYDERVHPTNTEIIAVSPAMQNALRHCRLYAKDDEPLLITGETGTGKGLLAHYVHSQSDRRNGPFVDINCAAIPSDLIESELFGHEKGSFTGATKRTIGKFERADGGTLFLDEIGDMSPRAQAKVLKVVEEGRLQRVGGTETISVNVRIIAATNRDLQASGCGFRDDLFFRLSILEIDIPPLRERVEDIIPLLTYFLSRYAGAVVTAEDIFGRERLSLMASYTWPGNVREIMKLTKQAVLKRKAKVAGGTDLLFADNLAQQFPLGDTPSEPTGARPITRSRLLHALEQAGGNKTEAARSLGISRPTLYRYLGKFDIG